jgi:hypothetical protein
MPVRHRDFLPIFMGVFGLVLLVGIINDEAIAAISPKHYTVFYPPYLSIQAPWAQALCFALLVTGGSGFAWGSLLYWVGHYGPGPQISPRATLKTAIASVVITLMVAWGLGWRTWATGKPLYSEFFYPSTDPQLVFSQTVQLTNEFVGLTTAGICLATISLWRWRHRAEVGNNS